MSLLAIIGLGLQITFLLIQKWFSWSDEQKQKAKEILNEVKDAKDASSVTLIFDRIHRL